MGNNKISYLLVEDDEAQACILAKWLKKAAEPHEIEVLIANNLEDAIRLSNEAKPSATFLDLHLPIIKGGRPVESDWKIVAAAIPKMIPPVIVVTAYEITPEMKVYLIADSGAHHVFQKPYNEGFFAKLKDDMKLFGVRLLAAAGDAELRSAKENGYGRTT